MAYGLLPATSDGTKSFAIDLIGSAYYSRVKVSFGLEGAAVDVSATNPLPVAGAVTVTGTVPVSGTFFQATQPISGSVGITGSVAVTGTFFQATQPVSLTALPALPAGANAIGAIVGLGVTKTDRSSTITTGSTSQTLMAANASRRGLEIQNTSAGDLWINDLGAAAVIGGSSFKLISGALYASDTQGVSVSAVTIIGATSTATFAAREW